MVDDPMRDDQLEGFIFNAIFEVDPIVWTVERPS
jgi:hypothetical protein